jgi:hypothetical protein
MMRFSLITVQGRFGEHNFVDCLRDLLFDPEDGDSKFVQNVRELGENYAASHPSR